ncbi:MAG: hypothetical protein NT154_22505 [Verrucomicrobia bacterium]|nr:hypothetical protein [Verrucomicrobiota bacterium]
MKATISGQTYNTEKAEEICTDASPDGDDILYRTKDGRFFLVVASTYLDGIKLLPSQDLHDRATELGIDTSLSEAGNLNWTKLQARKTYTDEIIPLTDRQALEWCVKTQMPDCFRGYVLEAI